MSILFLFLLLAQTALAFRSLEVEPSTIKLPNKEQLNGEALFAPPQAPEDLGFLNRKNEREYWYK